MIEGVLTPLGSMRALCTGVEASEKFGTYDETSAWQLRTGDGEREEALETLLLLRERGGLVVMNPGLQTGDTCGVSAPIH